MRNEVILLGSRVAETDNTQDVMAGAEEKLFSLGRTVATYLEADIGDVSVVLDVSEDGEAFYALDRLKVKSLKFEPSKHNGYSLLAFALREIDFQTTHVTVASAFVPAPQSRYLKRLVQYHEAGWITRPLCGNQAGYPIIFDQWFFGELQHMDSDDRIDPFIQANSHMLAYFPDFDGSTLPKNAEAEENPLANPSSAVFATRRFA